jgi:ornithine carbamoyltransferase
MPSTAKSLPQNQRHFLDLDRLSKDDLRKIIDVSRALKAGTPPAPASRSSSA